MNSQTEFSRNSLNGKLADYRAKSERLQPAFARAYDRLVARLSSIDRGEVGPAVGERMPEFLMPNHKGELISLGLLLERGPLVVSVNRGHWCPYCRLDLRALAAAQPDIERLGGQVVSIMPDSAAYTGGAFGSDPLPFPILSDVDLGYTLSLGLVYWIGADVAALYRELGIDLEQYQGNDSQFLPLTAKFVVGRDGLVKARHVDIEFRQRMEPAEIVEALERIRKEG